MQDKTDDEEFEDTHARGRERIGTDDECLRKVRYFRGNAVELACQPRARDPHSKADKRPSEARRTTQANWWQDSRSVMPQAKKSRGNAERSQRGLFKHLGDEIGSINSSLVAKSQAHGVRVRFCARAHV